METSQCLAVINSVLYKNYNLKRTNKIMLAMSYSFNLITKENFKIWNICMYILLKQKPNSEIISKFLHIMVLLYCFFSAYQNTYSLPCMLNQNKLNKKPNLHIVFGEQVSQLTNIVLISQGIKIVDEIFTNSKDKLEYTEFIHEELDWIAHSGCLLDNIADISNEKIQENLESMHYTFFRFGILITYKLLKAPLGKEKEKLIQKLYRISFNK